MRLFVRWIGALVIAALVDKAAAQGASWFGIYLQGAKLGYASYVAFDDELAGKGGSRNESLLVIQSKVLGDALNLRMETQSWNDKTGRPSKARYVTESSGRRQVVDLVYQASKAIADVDNNGARSRKEIPIPKGAVLLDDPTTMLVTSSASLVGKQKSFYVFDPTTISLVRNTARLVGERLAQVQGVSVKATLIEVVDPRATTRIYVGAKGDLVKTEGPMGLELIPEPKDRAMSLGGTMAIPPDLALSTAVPAEPPIKEPMKSRYVRMRVSGADLENAPNDKHQRIERSGGDWVVTIDPARLDRKATMAIAAAAKGQTQWTLPDTLIPSDSKSFRTLAKQVVGERSNVLDAALKIKDYVLGLMKPNAGIGGLRDAAEILRTKEGVCRDYAILTATLMRAAGIPTRLATGIVHWDGKFYYHAWVEVWTGREWLGIDSTRPEDQISATHVKLRQGKLDEAFVLGLLDGAKVTVLEVKY